MRICARYSCGRCKSCCGGLTRSRSKADQSQAATSQASTGVSPLRLANVRMKNHEQLCHLHTLFDDDILNEQEIWEQKGTILDTLLAL